MLYNKLMGYPPEPNLLLIVAAVAIVVTAISIAAYRKIKASAEKRAEEEAAKGSNQL